MATFPLSNSGTELVRQEVREEFHEEIDAARGSETELDQMDFWATRHNREIWDSKDWRSDATGFYD